LVDQHHEHQDGDHEGDFVRVLGFSVLFSLQRGTYLVSRPKTPK
jgi:hypothetical protein